MHIEVKAGYGQNPSVATMDIKRIFQVCGILPLPSTALAFLEACVLTDACPSEWIYSKSWGCMFKRILNLTFKRKAKSVRTFFFKPFKQFE